MSIVVFFFFNPEKFAEKTAQTTERKKCKIRVKIAIPHRSITEFCDASRLEEIFLDKSSRRVCFICKRIETTVRDSMTEV